MNQQDAKKAILDTIRNGKPESLPLPEIKLPPFKGDRLKDFINRLLAFDGRAVIFKTRADALNWLKENENAAKDVIYSSVNDIQGNLLEEEMADLTNASKITVCITEGLMGVAEMGSIWVTNESLRHAVSALLALRLVILLDSENIVGNLSEAYDRLNLKEIQYGAFYAGPSATADIEAVRISGAQGPLALMALVYNCEDATEPPQILAPDPKPAQVLKELT